MHPGESSSRRGRPRRKASLIITPEIDHETARENRRRRKARMRGKMCATRSTGCFQPICTPFFHFPSTVHLFLHAYV
jgi:hypothetical protein